MPASNPTAKKERPEAELTRKPKTPYSERGHAVNIEHLAQMRQMLIGLGESYVNSIALYTAEHLETVYNQAMTDMHNVASALAANNAATANMVVSFAGIKKMSTRAKNIFIVSGVPSEAIGRCNYLNHKIQGSRVVAVDKDADGNHSSASQNSRTQIISHLEDLIELFLTYPQYQPPADLTAAAFTVVRDEMYATQQDATVTSTNLKLARIQRNLTLYTPVTGLVDVGLGTKKVVLGNFGATSPQFDMVKGIQFTRINGYKNL